MRAELVKLQAQYLIEMEDAVVVTRDANGRPQLHQAVNLTAAGAAGTACTACTCYGRTIGARAACTGSDHATAQYESSLT